MGTNVEQEPGAPKAGTPQATGVGPQPGKDTKPTTSSISAPLPKSETAQSEALQDNAPNFRQQQEQLQDNLQLRTRNAKTDSTSSTTAQVQERPSAGEQLEKLLQQSKPGTLSPYDVLKALKDLKPEEARALLAEVDKQTGESLAERLATNCSPEHAKLLRTLAVDGKLDRGALSAELLRESNALATERGEFRGHLKSEQQQAPLKERAVEIDRKLSGLRSNYCELVGSDAALMANFDAQIQRAEDVSRQHYISNRVWAHAHDAQAYEGLSHGREQQRQLDLLLQEQNEPEGDKSGFLSRYKSFDDHLQSDMERARENGRSMRAFAENKLVKPMVAELDRDGIFTSPRHEVVAQMLRECSRRQSLVLADALYQERYQKPGYGHLWDRVNGQFGTGSDAAKLFSSRINGPNAYVGDRLPPEEQERFCPRVVTSRETELLLSSDPKVRQALELRRVMQSENAALAVVELTKGKDGRELAATYKQVFGVGPLEDPAVLRAMPAPDQAVIAEVMTKGSIAAEEFDTYIVLRARENRAAREIYEQTGRGGSDCARTCDQEFLKLRAAHRALVNGDETSMARFDAATESQRSAVKGLYRKDEKGLLVPSKERVGAEFIVCADEARRALAAGKHEQAIAAFESFEKSHAGEAELCAQCKQMREDLARDKAIRELGTDQDPLVIAMRDQRAELLRQIKAQRAVIHSSDHALGQMMDNVKRVADAGDNELFTSGYWEQVSGGEKKYLAEAENEQRLGNAQRSQLSRLENRLKEIDGRIDQYTSEQREAAQQAARGNLDGAKQHSEKAFAAIASFREDFEKAAKTQEAVLAKQKPLVESYQKIMKEAQELHSQGKDDQAQEKAKQANALLPAINELSKSMQLNTDRALITTSEYKQNVGKGIDELIGEINANEKRLRAIRTTTLAVGALASGNWWYFGGLCTIAVGTNGIEQGVNALQGNKVSGTQFLLSSAEDIKNITINRFAGNFGRGAGGLLKGGSTFVLGTSRVAQVTSGVVSTGGAGFLTGEAMELANLGFDAAKHQIVGGEFRKGEVGSRLFTAGWTGLAGGWLGGGCFKMEQAFKGVTGAQRSIVALEYAGGFALGALPGEGNFADRLIGGAQGMGVTAAGRGAASRESTYRSEKTVTGESPYLSQFDELIGRQNPAYVKAKVPQAVLPVEVNGTNGTSSKKAPTLEYESNAASKPDAMPREQRIEQIREQQALLKARADEVKAQKEELRKAGVPEWKIEQTFDPQPKGLLDSRPRGADVPSPMEAAARAAGPEMLAKFHEMQAAMQAKVRAEINDYLLAWEAKNNPPEIAAPRVEPPVTKPVEIAKPVEAPHTEQPGAKPAVETKPVTATVERGPERIGEAPRDGQGFKLPNWGQKLAERLALLSAFAAPGFTNEARAATPAAPEAIVRVEGNETRTVTPERVTPERANVERVAREQVAVERSVSAKPTEKIAHGGGPKERAPGSGATGGAKVELASGAARESTPLRQERAAASDPMALPSEQAPKTQQQQQHSDNSQHQQENHQQSLSQHQIAPDMIVNNVFQNQIQQAMQQQTISNLNTNGLAEPRTPKEEEHPGRRRFGWGGHGDFLEDERQRLSEEQRKREEEELAESEAEANRVGAFHIGGTLRKHRLKIAGEDAQAGDPESGQDEVAGMTQNEYLSWEDR